MVIGSIVVAAAGIGGYYYLTQNNQGQKTQTAVIDFNNEIANFDPHKENYPDESYLMAIYSHFIEQKPDLSYASGVFSSWQWNSDKTELDVTLNQNIKFHNGDQLTAADVEFSLQRMASQGMPFAGVWSVFSPITVVDDYHLKLGMAHFDPSITSWIGFLAAYVLPKNAFNSAGATAFFQNPIGCGPYKFVSYSQDVLKLTAFQDYFNGAPEVKDVIFKSVLDPNTRASDVESGGANLTEAVNVADYKRLSTESGLAGASGPVSLVFQLFHVPYFPLWANEDLRLACHYAIDKNSIVQNVLLGFGIPLSTVAAPQYKSYPSSYSFPYDQNMAKQILSSHGYTPTNPLKIDVNVFQGVQALDYQVMQAVAQMWATVGIQANLIPMTQQQFFTLRDGGKLGALTTDTWTDPTGDPINNVGFTFKPDGGFAVLPLPPVRQQLGLTDYTGYYGADGNGTLKQIIDPVFTTVEDQQRYQAGQNAAVYASQHGLVIPLYQVYEPYIMRSNVKYTPYGSGWLRADALSFTS